ncbi:hypothetical protein diail_9082, partial [Diaporthe ilicicola]
MDRNDSKEVQKWHDAVLIGRYGLQAPCICGKDIANADTLLVLLTFNIKFDTGIFSSEKHRVRLPGCYLGLAFTGARPAEFVDGERKSGNNGCLEELFPRRTAGTATVDALAIRRTEAAARVDAARRLGMAVRILQEEAYHPPGSGRSLDTIRRQLTLGEKAMYQTEAAREHETISVGGGTAGPAEEEAGELSEPQPLQRSHLAFVSGHVGLESAAILEGAGNFMSRYQSPLFGFGVSMDTGAGFHPDAFPWDTSQLSDFFDQDGQARVVSNTRQSWNGPYASDVISITPAMGPVAAAILQAEADTQRQGHEGSGKEHAGADPHALGVQGAVAPGKDTCAEDGTTLAEHAKDGEAGTALASGALVVGDPGEGEGDGGEDTGAYQKGREVAHGCRLQGGEKGVAGGTDGAEDNDEYAAPAGADGGQVSRQRPKGRVETEDDASLHVILVVGEGRKDQLEVELAFRVLPAAVDGPLANDDVLVGRQEPAPRGRGREVIPSKGSKEQGRDTLCAHGQPAGRIKKLASRAEPPSLTNNEKELPVMDPGLCLHDPVCQGRSEAAGERGEGDEEAIAEAHLAAVVEKDAFVQPMNPLRKPCEYRIIAKGHANDDKLGINTQGSSHWDGLHHYPYQKTLQYYNGVVQEKISGPTAGQKIGIQSIARRGITGQGVLLDWAAYAQDNDIKHSVFEAHAIPLPQLLEVARHQQTSFRAGDILFVRTGWLRQYRKLSPDEQALPSRATRSSCGVEASEDMIRWHWDNAFAAVASDVPAYEAWPSSRPAGVALHEVFLSGWGLPIGESFDLEVLADR